MLRAALNVEELRKHEAFINRICSQAVVGTGAVVELSGDAVSFYVNLESGAARLRVPTIGGCDTGLFAVSTLVLPMMFRYFASVDSASMRTSEDCAHVEIHWDTGSARFPTLHSNNCIVPELDVTEVLWRTDSSLASAVLSDFFAVDGTGHRLGDYLWIAPLPDAPDKLSIFGGDGTICSSALISVSSHRVVKPVPIHHTFIRSMSAVCSTQSAEVALAIKGISEGRFHLQAECGPRLIRSTCPAPYFKHDIFERIFSGVSTDTEIKSKELSLACRQFVIAVGNSDRFAPGRIGFGLGTLTISARDTKITASTNESGEPKHAAVNIVLLERTLKNQIGNTRLGIHKGMLALSGDTRYGSVTTVLASASEAAGI